VLAPQEAFELLCARRKPVGAEEESAARGIAEDLGHHTLAVDVAGAALDAQAGLVSFAQFRVKLADPATDELEFAAELAEALPSGHETSAAATLLRSVRSLSEEGQDFLRLASVLAVAPIPPKLVALTIAGADGLEESQAVRKAALSLSAVERASLAERAEGDARLVHTLVSRAVRFHDTAPDRTRVVRGAAARASRRSYQRSRMSVAMQDSPRKFSTRERSALPTCRIWIVPALQDGSRVTTTRGYLRKCAGA
jgi:hypothetical protein